jgi:hypothetical protein
MTEPRITYLKNRLVLTTYGADYDQCQQKAIEAAEVFYSGRPVHLHPGRSFVEDELMSRDGREQVVQYGTEFEIWPTAW